MSISVPPEHQSSHTDDQLDGSDSDAVLERAGISVPLNPADADPSGFAY
jgi:hypothetical protein